MKNNKEKILEILNFPNIYDKSICLKVLSQDDIYNLSYGEVFNANTIDYKTLLPIIGGLHGQEIFGPVKNNTCLCNKKHHRINFICNDCGVEVTNSIVRRERLGHIKLNTPIINPLFYSLNAVFISILLNIKNIDLLNIINFKAFIVIKPDLKRNLFQFKILNDIEVVKLLNNSDFIIYKDPSSNLEIGTGSDAILRCLEEFDIKKEFNTIINKLKKQNEKTISKFNTFELKKVLFLRLLIQKNIDLKNLVFSNYLPVLPAGLRPIVRLKKIGEGLFGGVDLDQHYRKVCNRNNKLIKIKAGSSSLMIKWCKKLIQSACELLFDNRKINEYKRKKDLKISKSLLENIIGKQGFFRSNILGKRVDYSARSVIALNSSLNINQIGIPISIAIFLFEPQLISKLLLKYPEKNFFEIIRLVKSQDKIIYKTLYDLIQNRTVLINRAPTLHKYSIQSFDIVLTDDDVIHLHPLVCYGFNADFDGDQVMVLSLLDYRSEIESNILMKSDRNLFLSTNGRILFMPNREMILGMYWITIMLDKSLDNSFDKKIFSENEILLLLEFDKIHPQQIINLVYNNQIIKTTVGRVFMNSLIPNELRNYNVIFNNSFLEKLIYKMYKKFNINFTLNFLDQIKKYSFRISTWAGISLSVCDFIDVNKKKLILEGKQYSQKIINLFINKKITEKEMHMFINYNWLKIFENLKHNLLKKLSKDKNNLLYLCLKSGARASIEQIFQVSVLKGLFVDSDNNIINLPVLNSLKEGLNSFQTFVAASGSRKGVIDKALKTGVSGYLSRKISVLLSEKIIDSIDCKTDLFIFSEFSKSNTYNYFLALLFGRFIIDDIIINQKVLFKKGIFLDRDNILEIYNIFINSDEKNIIIKYRSPLTCNLNSLNAFCIKCFGLSFENLKPVQLGEIVGINSSQALGEPGTQLTLRTFHKGGIARFKTLDNLIYSNDDNCYIEYNLKDCFIQENEIITLININISIKTKEGKIIKNILVNSGSKIFFKPLEKIKKGDLIIKKNNFQNIYSCYDGKLIVENALLIPKKNLAYGVTIYKIKNSLLNTDKKPFGILVDNKNNILEKYKLSLNMFLFVKNNSFVKKGTLLFKNIHFESKKHDITGGLPKINNILENILLGDKKMIIMPYNGLLYIDEKNNLLYLFNIDFSEYNKNTNITLKELLKKYKYIKLNRKDIKLDIKENKVYFYKNYILQNGDLDVNFLLENNFDVTFIKKVLCKYIFDVYVNFGIYIPIKHIEVLISSLFVFCIITYVPKELLTKYFVGEILYIDEVNKINKSLKEKIKYRIIYKGMSNIIYNDKRNFLNSISYQHTTQNLIKYAITNSENKLDGVMKNFIMNMDIKGGTSYLNFINKEKRVKILNKFLLELKKIFIKYDLYSVEKSKKIYQYYINIIEDISNKYFLSYVLSTFYDDFIKKNNNFNLLIKDKNIVAFLLEKIILKMIGESI